MKLHIGILSLILLLPFASKADDSPAGLSVDKAFKDIMKITELGPKPERIKFIRSDPSIFLVNSTKDSLITFKIDFGKRRLHCASPNLKMTDDGALESVSPISPKDFALTCFPEKGIYTITIFGLSRYPKGVKGIVEVANE